MCVVTLVIINIKPIVSKTPYRLCVITLKITRLLTIVLNKGAYEVYESLRVEYTRYTKLGKSDI